MEFVTSVLASVQIFVCSNLDYDTTSLGRKGGRKEEEKEKEEKKNHRVSRGCSAFTTTLDLRAGQLKPGVPHVKRPYCGKQTHPPTQSEEKIYTRSDFIGSGHQIRSLSCETRHTEKILYLK